LTRAGIFRSFAAVIVIWAASRGLLLGSGLFGAAALGSGRALQSGNIQRSWEGPAPLEIWARWDAEWYLLIAEEGYHLEERLARRRVDYGSADATGFFPLYPLAIRALGSVLERLPGTDRIPVRILDARAPESGSGRRGALIAAALIISNGALVSLLLLLYRHVLDTQSRSPTRATPDAHSRAALLACAALLCFPPSLFLSAVYADALLLLLAVLCFRYLRRRRWWTAAAVGALASAAKPGGILLAIPAAVMLFRAGRTLRDEGSPPTRWLSLALYPAGAAAFSLYCARAFGDPLSWLHRQARWRGTLSGPWRAFIRWAEEPRIHGAHGSTVELAFAILALILLLVVIRRRSLAESAFAAAVVIPPLGSSLWSFGRLSLQAFPLFIVLGEWAARRPLLSLVYFIPATAGSMILMAYYAAWWWAG
jgi:hypothetical protein